METKQENRQIGLPLERRAQAISQRALKTEYMKSKLTAGFAEYHWFTKEKKFYLEEEIQCRDFVNFLIL